jgi:cell division protein FtsA
MAQAYRTRTGSRRPAVNEVIGVLDIGTSKICCLIATITNPPRLLGLGHHRANGITAGMIVDLPAAEHAVRAAVARAEQQAGITLEAVHVAIAGGGLVSDHFAASARVAQGVVGEGDIARLFAGARAYCGRDGRTLVHMNRIAYRLDAATGIQNPRGMAGRTLVGDLHAVTADEGPVRNLQLLIERCFLAPGSLTPAALASARATATMDEMRQGVIVIDIGAGTTKIAVVADGHDIFVDGLPLGGDYLTYGIMGALGTSLAEAERIKVLYGTLIEAGSDDRDVVTYPRLNDEPAGELESDLRQTTRAHLRQLIKPRVETLLQQVMEKLVASGMHAYGGSKIVVTGGGAQLVGLPLFASRLCGMSVRVAQPHPLLGMGPSACSPTLATAVGLVAAAANPASVAVVDRRRPSGRDDYLGRVGQWLRESF